jgi:hypothetical protein
MTKKRAETSEYTRLQLNQYRLRKIAMELEFGKELSIPDTCFLIQALRKIGEGGDANVAFQLNVRKGERTSPAHTAKTNQRRFALSYLATLIAPESEGGFGMTLEDAIDDAAKKFKGQANFGYTAETLKNYWNNYPEWRTRDFPRPIETLPDRAQYEAELTTEPK